jgi:hypothetical protein
MGAVHRQSWPRASLIVEDSILLILLQIPRSFFDHYGAPAEAVDPMMVSAEGSVSKVEMD